MAVDVVPPLLWSPDPAWVADAPITAFAQLASARSGRPLETYDDLWEWSVRDLSGFWQAVSDFFSVRWHARPEAVLDNPVLPGARWFPGGALNYAERALSGAGLDPAVIAVAEDGSEQQISRAELRRQVAAVQAALRARGVEKGDRVVALAPNTLPTLVAFLATAACGAVWSSCSPDFGAGAVIDRFAQIEPKVLFAVDGYRYGGREFDIRPTVARVREAVPSITEFIHLPGLSADAPAGSTGWTQLLAENRHAETTFATCAFDDPLWVLYSSGTTGLPKPIVQSVGGIVLEHLKSINLQMDIRAGDRFLWFSTTGWMMWNLLIGGLLVGATVVLYDGSPGHPDLTALWRLTERHRINYLGVSAAYVTSCRKAGLRPRVEHDLSSIRALGSTGSPLDSDGFGWIRAEVGPNVQISSLSGGTDICTGIVGAAPTVPVWLGEISARCLGAAVDSFSPEGRSLVNEVGELVITAPMPSMPIYFWADPDGKRLREAYFEDFPGVWRHGDWIRITPRGSCVIEGRSDATLNRGGVRMGTAEFYRVVESLPQVLDSLVIDLDDLVLFVRLAEGADLEAVRAAVKVAVRQDLSPRHVPGRILGRADDSAHPERQEVRGAGQAHPHRNSGREGGFPRCPGRSGGFDAFLQVAMAPD